MPDCPPGHHALRGDGMGFCIFANVSLAAVEALARFGLNRVLIVDFDVHHGNGTQKFFYDSERVGFLSIHRFPFYPGTGAKNETGTGADLAHPEHPPGPRHAAVRVPCVVPSRPAFPGRPHQARTRSGHAGFDAHAEDPVGDLGLEVEDFETITREIVEVAEAHARAGSSACSRGGTTCPSSPPARRRISTPWALNRVPT